MVDNGLIVLLSDANFDAVQTLATSLLCWDPPELLLSVLCLISAAERDFANGMNEHSKPITDELEMWREPARSK